MTSADLPMRPGTRTHGVSSMLCVCGCRQCVYSCGEGAGSRDGLLGRTMHMSMHARQPAGSSSGESRGNPARRTAHTHPHHQLQATRTWQRPRCFGCSREQSARRGRTDAPVGWGKGALGRAGRREERSRLRSGGTEARARRARKAEGPGTAGAAICMCDSVDCWQPQLSPLRAVVRGSRFA